MSVNIEQAAAEAQFEFWRKIIELYPEARSGDFDPGSQFAFDTACEEAVRRWVYYNVGPDEAEPEG